MPSLFLFIYVLMQVNRMLFSYLLYYCGFYLWLRKFPNFLNVLYSLIHSRNFILWVYIDLKLIYKHFKLTYHSTIMNHYSFPRTKKISEVSKRRNNWSIHNEQLLMQCIIKRVCTHSLSSFGALFRLCAVTLGVRH